jgi:hypothetical protein
VKENRINLFYFKIKNKILHSKVYQVFFFSSNSITYGVNVAVLDKELQLPIFDIGKEFSGVSGMLKNFKGKKSFYQSEIFQELAGIFRKYH